MTVTQRLWILCGTFMAIMTVTTGIGLWSVQNLNAEIEDARNVDIPAIRNATLVDMMHDGIRATVFRAIVASGSKDEKEIQEIKNESEEMGKNIKGNLKNLENLNLPVATKTLLEKAKPRIDVYVDASYEVVELALKGKAARALEKLPSFQEKFEALEKDLGTLGEAIKIDSEQSNTQSKNQSERAKWIGIGVLIVGLVFGGLLSTYIVAELSTTLRGVAKTLSIESGQVSKTSQTLNESAQSLEQSSSMQSSALQRTAASVDQITAMVKKTEENSAQLRTNAEASKESALQGQNDIRIMIDSMNTIQESNEKIISQIEDGNRRMTEIIQVINEIESKTKVINDIVFQTKLLSFNASVEAARAGEHGKGFAVVAEEVGNLAQMSGNASKEISSMLSSSIEKVNEIVRASQRSVESLIADGKNKLDRGKDTAKKCDVTLEEIVNRATGVGVMVNEITTAIQEYNIGIQEITKAIELLDQSTNANVSTSKMTSSNSESLKDQSLSLASIVDTLNAMVGSSNDTQTNTERSTHSDLEFWSESDEQKAA